MLERIRAVVGDDDYHLIEALAKTVFETTRELRKTVSLRGACVGGRFLQRDPCLWGAERATG